MGERRRDRNWTLQVTALYDYEPEQPDELGFQEGDVLRVIRVQDDGWWSGYNVDNSNVVGLFPSNYVQAQRGANLQQNTNIAVASSRQRIQLQPQTPPDTPELDDEDESDDKAQELPEFRGHVGTVLQLRKQLENAERASEAVQNARRQAEREKLRHQKSWREREQEEPEDGDERLGLQLAPVFQQQTANSEDEDNEDDDEQAYPQSQGHMHASDRQEENGEESNDNDVQAKVEQEEAAETEEIENAAASLIAKGFKRHCALFQLNREREREAEQRRLSKIAAVCIQRWAAHAHSRQCKRRQWEIDQSAARRCGERENEAATEIQKWIRMRWASFWRRRVRSERRNCVLKESQEANEVKNTEHNQAQLEVEQEEEVEHQVVVDDRRRLEEEEEKRRLVQLKCKEEEQRREIQLKAVEEQVQARFLQQEEDKGQLSVEDPAVPSAPDKPRRKVMKKEAVELIRTLVQQQLSETLRGHDEKMDELQRMVVRLQTVVRKQTQMLEDSTDQLVSLQALQKEQRVLVPPKSNGNSSFLPRIGAGPRQPETPSGLRAPRPVVLSKLPVLASNGRRPSCNQSRKI